MAEVNKTRRHAIVALLALPLADVRAFQTPTARTLYKGGGHLRIPLDQWEGITVEHRGQAVTLSAAAIFAALTGA